MIERDPAKSLMPLHQNSRLCQFFTVTGVYSGIATCFFIPLSTSLMDFFALLMFCCWILSGKIRELPYIFKKSPFSFFAVLLFILLLIGISYSSADLLYAFGYLKKYRKLIFIPAVISLMGESQEAKKNAEYSFIAGCVVLLLISYAMHFSLLPFQRYGDSILFHITHSFFMAILAFWSLHYFYESKQYRYLWLLLFVGAVVNNMYIAPGRTGMFVLPLLLLLFAIQRFSLKKQLICLLLLSSLAAGVFLTSNNFSSRIKQALHEIHTYDKGAARTSLGQRFDWWIDSLDMIREKPFFGHGTGAFTAVHDRMIRETKVTPTDNPHNEYLLITVQTGLLGLLIFFLLFIVQWVGSLKFPDKDKYLVQGVVLAMTSGCIMNSFLFDTHQGHFYAFLSGIFFASVPRRPLSIKRLI
jgi:O-antigen ligase